MHDPLLLLAAALESSYLTVAELQQRPVWNYLSPELQAMLLESSLTNEDIGVVERLYELRRSRGLQLTNLSGVRTEWRSAFPNPR